MKKVIFAADAGRNIGTGHIKRCLSLAKGLAKSNFECLFVIMPEEGRIIRKEVKENGFETKKYEDILKIKPDVIITDSYRLNCRNIKHFKTMCSVLVSIDDLAKIEFYSDIVINQNIYAKSMEEKYVIQKYTKLLLGPSYAILNESFVQEKKEITKDVRTLLVTMGGTDVHNQTLRIIQALKGLDIEITVVLGMFYEYKRKLLNKIESMDGKITVLENIDNMAEIMKKSDIAISSSGTTTYELMCMGVPSIFLVLAENQKYNAYECDKQGIAVYLGWFNNLSKYEIRNSIVQLISNFEKRKSMSYRTQNIVDGKGVIRIVEEIEQALINK